MQKKHAVVETKIVLRKRASNCAKEKRHKYILPHFLKFSFVRLWQHKFNFQIPDHSSTFQDIILNFQGQTERQTAWLSSRFVMVFSKKFLKEEVVDFLAEKWSQSTNKEFL